MSPGLLNSTRRRQRSTALAALVLAVAITVVVRAASGPAAPSAVLAGDSAPVSILAWFDFPKSDPRSAELSGIAWDDATRTLYAITDDAPRIIPIRPSADYRTWSFGEPIVVQTPMEWDGEGIVLTASGFIISNEVGPTLLEVTRTGETVAQLPQPAQYSRILRNRGFEALTITADGRYLFAANESPLEGDGPQPSATSGGVVRILRYDRIARTTAVYAYRTDPIPPPASDGSDRGVVDLVALSATDLLVMERSFIPNYGNNVRIYRASIAGAPDILAIPNLTESTPSIAKTLLVDLASLPDDQFPETRQPQPNKILDNFEGLALGPLLPDGRRILFVISDDNKRDTQTPRILVLAVAGL